VASLIHIQEQMAKMKKNEISIPEIFRKMFVGFSSFLSAFISFTNLRYFSWWGDL